MASRLPFLSEYPREHLKLGRERYYDKLEYTPKLGQRLLDEAVDSGKRFIGYFTPPQDGKSYGIAKQIGSYLFLPGIQMWIVAPTYPDGKKEFEYLYQDLAVMGALRTAKRKYFDVRGGNMYIELRNQSWVKVISLSEGSDSLRRDQVDIAVYAEASKLTENPLPKMLARLEKRHGLAFWPSTHKGYGWMWDQVAVASMPTKPKTGEWTSWKDGRRERLGGEENPTYDPEYWSCQVSYVPEFGDVFHAGEYPPEVIEKARKRLPPPMFAEQFGGEAASYAGLIYPFDPTIHECDPFDPPPSWTYVIGYDHGAGGGSDPTAIEFGAYDSDGTLYWWNEVYDVAVHSISQRAQYIKLKLNGRQPAMIMRGRDAKQVGKELSDAGLFSSYPPDPDITARIIRMTELMQARKCKLMRGRVPHLRREILAYEWDQKNPGKPMDGNDHAIEAAGYGSLAPVTLPAAGAMVPDTPASRVQKERHDLLWGELETLERDQRSQKEGRRLEAIFEPDPMAAVVGAWIP